KIFQQRAGDKNRRCSSAHRVTSIESTAAGHERQIFPQSRLPARLGSDFQLRRLACVLQTVRRWRVEERLSAAQSRRIFPRVQRYWPVGDDVAGGSEI